MSKNRINWSLSKKKQRDSDREEKEALQDKQRALNVLADAYRTLKKRLLRRKHGRPKEDVYNFLLDLRNLVTANLDKEGLKDHKDFCLQMIEEKFNVAKAINVNERNAITCYQPDRPLDAPGKEFHKAGMQAFFATEEELLEIPWVKKVMEQEGFVGFLIQWPMLVAWFDDEETVKVGFLVNSIGLGRFPTFNEFRDAWIQQKAPAKDKKDN